MNFADEVKGFVKGYCGDNKECACGVYQDVLAAFTGIGKGYAEDGEVRSMVSAILNTCCPTCGKTVMWMCELGTKNHSAWCCGNYIRLYHIAGTEDCRIKVRKRIKVKK